MQRIVKPDLPKDHPPVRIGKVGILLVNLGTPDAPTAKAVRPYLAEFLADKRVVDYPRWLWMPVLHGIILNTRPRKTAHAYAQIWHEESGESPLRYYTRAQTDRIAGAIARDDVIVDWAMRYGNPSIRSRLAALQEQGCDRIVILPLYPQYSATTTGTVMDEVGRYLGKAPWQPTIRMVPPFHDHPLYIDALARSVAGHVTPDTEQVILSFHGLPERYLKAGDPYHCHCHKTARLLREKMGWSEDFAPLGFQSKFGPEKWLGPATEDLVIEAAKAGKKHIAIMAPAFIADCIETLEEVGIGLAETFQAHGGETLTAIPCLNDSDPCHELLLDIVRTESAGWIESTAASSAIAAE